MFGYICGFFIGERSEMGYYCFLVLGTHQTSHKTAIYQQKNQHRKKK